MAFLAGGETVVHLRGRGKGGRNQEIALSAARGIAGLSNVAVFSFGSDGTDGPTDAAGGYADGSTAARLLEAGLSIPDVLERNDAYHALENRMAFLLQAQQGPMSTICPCFLLADDDVKRFFVKFWGAKVSMHSWRGHALNTVRVLFRCVC